MKRAQDPRSVLRNLRQSFFEALKEMELWGVEVLNSVIKRAQKGLDLLNSIEVY